MMLPIGEQQKFTLSPFNKKGIHNSSTTKKSDTQSKGSVIKRVIDLSSVTLVLVSSLEWKSVVFFMIFFAFKTRYIKWLNQMIEIATVNFQRERKICNLIKWLNCSGKDFAGVTSTWIPLHLQQRDLRAWMVFSPLALRRDKIFTAACAIASGWALLKSSISTKVCRKH